MNQIYKVIWSKVKHQYVVVSELAHSNGKQSRTARKSLRSRIAALVVCGAIAAFGVYGALPTGQAFAATAAPTISGQYIAIVYGDVAPENGQWNNPNASVGNAYQWDGSKWIKCENSRTFIGTDNEEHKYVLQDVNGTKYWVRDGYTISITQHSNFETEDKSAPVTNVVIDSKKGDNADDKGLITSSEVLITKDEKHTTLTGNKLNQIDAGIYGGATTQGGTKVPIDYHYFINNNDNGYVKVGQAKDWNDFTNTKSNNGYFQEVYYQKDGTYNTKEDGSGTTVSSEYLYAIDATPSSAKNEENDVRLGAFFNSNGTIYTGKVFGNGNEVLMTGYDENTDSYYSYWGTKITDRNMSLANLTVGDLTDIKEGLEGSIYTAQGDDIKNIKVAEAPDGNGGTIGLVRHGDYIGDDKNGDPIYNDTTPVPGTITIQNTTTSGKNGNDVAIQFGSIDESGNNDSKFTIDAGSRVVGKITDEGTQVLAGVDDAGKTLTGLSINGVDYQLSQGKTYTKGNGIAISTDETTGDNTISVDLATDGQTNVSGLHFNATGQLANNLSIKEATPVEGDKNTTHSNKGNWSIIEDTGNGTTKTFTNTTLSSEVNETNKITNEETGDKEIVYGRDYTIKDTDGNEALLSDVASAKTLQNVNNRLITTEGTLEGAVMYDKNGDTYNKTSVTLGGFNENGQKNALVNLTNIATAKTDENAQGYDSSAAVNVGLLKSYATYTEADGIDITDNKVSVNVGDGLEFTDDPNDKGTKALKVKTGDNLEINKSGVDLKDNITLGEGNNQIQINGAPEGNEPAISVEQDTFTVGHDGSIQSTVAIDGMFTDTKDTFKFDKTGATFTKETTTGKDITKTSTNINGGTVTIRNDETGNNQTIISGKTITAGDIKFNGEENQATMTGLTNTTWDGTTNNESRAATEGQLSTLDKFAVKYDKDENGNPDYGSISLEGYTDGNDEKHGTQIHNVEAGTEKNDAVNLGQLEGKTGDLNYSNNNYVTDNEDLTVSIGKLDTQVYQNTTSITKLQGQTIDGGYVEDGVINLTHKNDDNTTKTVAQIDGLEDYTLQNSQFITKAKDENGKFTGATELTIADRYDPTKTEKVTIDGLVTYNTTQKLDETTGETIVTGIDYDNIRLAGENGTRITNLVDGWVDEKSTDAVNGSQLASVKDGAVKYWQNEDGSYDKSFVQLEGGEDGTLVTHVRDGAVNEYSSDAVNGSQLWETQQQIEEVQTEAGKHTTVTVNGGMTAPEDGSYTHDENGKLDGNLLLKQTNNDGQIEYDLKLNPDLTLQGEDGSTARVEIGGTNGTIMATKDPTDMSATTTIDGGNIYAGSSITVGTPNENEIVIRCASKTSSL